MSLAKAGVLNGKQLAGLTSTRRCESPQSSQDICWQTLCTHREDCNYQQARVERGHKLRRECHMGTQCKMDARWQDLDEFRCFCRPVLLEENELWFRCWLFSGMDMTYALLSWLYGSEQVNATLNEAEYAPHVDPHWDPFSVVHNVSHLLENIDLPSFRSSFVLNAAM